MRKVREAVGTVIRLVRGGVFAGNHKPVKYDAHTLATTGNDTISRMEEREDRFDQVQSALADRYRDVAYYGDRSW